MEAVAVMYFFKKLTNSNVTHSIEMMQQWGCNSIVEKSKLHNYMNRKTNQPKTAVKRSKALHPAHMTW